MNDELMLNNYLMILKSTVEVYVHGTLESSNKDIRDLLKKGLDETMEHQANTYYEMAKERGENNKITTNREVYLAYDYVNKSIEF